MRPKLSWVITFFPLFCLLTFPFVALATCVTAICLIRWFSSSHIYLAFTQHPFLCFFLWQLLVSDLISNGNLHTQKWPSGMHYTEQGTFCSILPGHYLSFASNQSLFAKQLQLGLWFWIMSLADWFIQPLGMASPDGPPNAPVFILFTAKCSPIHLNHQLCQ